MCGEDDGRRERESPGGQSRCCVLCPQVCGAGAVDCSKFQCAPVRTAECRIRYIKRLEKLKTSEEL